MALCLQIITFLLTVGFCISQFQNIQATDNDGISCTGQIVELKQKLEEMHIQQESLNAKLISEIEQLKAARIKIESVNADPLSRQRKALNPELNVAFTAILSKDTNGLGPNQTIVFDHPILNVGNHYNIHSGIFTAPMDGVYSFSFFIGERGVDQIFADLYVNDQHVVSATTEGTHDSHDTQGGNSANVMMTAGDIATVKHVLGNHLESGEVDGMATSFSGFLIFPFESQPVDIIGK